MISFSMPFSTTNLVSSYFLTSRKALISLAFNLYCLCWSSLVTKKPSDAWSKHCWKTSKSEAFSTNTSPSTSFLKEGAYKDPSCQIPIHISYWNSTCRQPNHFCTNATPTNKAQSTIPVIFPDIERLSTHFWTCSKPQENSNCTLWKKPLSTGPSTENDISRLWGDLTVLTPGYPVPK